MIPSNFDYVAPTTVDDAVAALAQGGEDAKVIAGGQTLMPVLRLRLAAPTVLVDLNRIDELRGVRDDGDALVVGAMTTYYGLLGNPLISKHALLLVDATRTVADPQIRHRGTLGGIPPRLDIPDERLLTPAPPRLPTPPWRVVLPRFPPCRPTFRCALRWRLFNESPRVVPPNLFAVPRSP